MFNFVKNLTIILIMEIKYHNLYIHFVLTTLNRMPVIPEKNRQRIEKYITGIVKNNKCRLYAIYANPEHVHLLISKVQNIDEEELITIIAGSSERFINENKLCVGLFQWQDSCSAFSVSKRDIPKICDYIQNQSEHHKKQCYEEENAAFIKFYQQTIKK